jgi:uncharacterized protein (TIGR03435 family)
MRIIVPSAIAVAICTAGLNAGQAPERAPAPSSFEAASVKANRSGDSGSSTRRQPGGRFNVVNTPLRNLITLAYAIQGYQLVDAPDWVSTERFDIVAKLEGDPPPMPPGTLSDPMLVALRSLLTERFTLTIHRETRDMDIYALTMARADRRLGPALKPSTQDCAAWAARGGGPPPAAATGGATPPVMCGIRGQQGRVLFGGSPLSMFATALAGPVGRVVVDRTGLTGAWDFELTFSGDPQRGLPSPGVEPPPDDPNAPSLFTALQEQLGLKLEATKGPVEVVVVDRVERPAPD